MADEWQRVVLPEVVFWTGYFVYSARLRDILMAKNLLSPDDIEEIGQIKTTTERVHELIWKNLSKKGPGSLLKFVEALEEDDLPQSTLAQLLRSRLSEGATTTTSSVSPSASSFLDEMVTKDERRDVARRMKANWRRVGDILGPNPMFQSYDLNSFEEKRNNQDRAQAMLDAWSQKHLKKATRRVLIRALKEEGYGTLIRDVFKWDPDDVSPLPSEHTNRARET
ncbi:uncharacterized protein [Oscarella lobularis]|uniref:uncharacterized protein n=1 Tax=Oscarella lobularis TaxID=121494 RepID=UPI0033143044